MGKADQPRITGKTVAAALVAGGVAALGTVLCGSAAPLFAGVAAVAAFAFGLRHGARAVERHGRAKLFRIADELVQYRSFTRLLRDQGSRITGMTGDAALVLAAGLHQMDEAVAELSVRIDGLAAAGQDADLVLLRAEAEAIAQPIVEMLGKLQFQDVTQQQLMFLSRLSLLVEAHMEELARLLGDRRSLDRTSRFQEMFEQALGDTVMTSQRNDHHAAAGIALFEPTGPKVELF